MEITGFMTKRSYCITAILIGFAAAVGALLLLPLIFCVIIAVIIGAIMCIKFPKTAMIVLAIYLIFQDFIAFQTEEMSLMWIIFKRSEEFVILGVFMMMFLRNIGSGKLWIKTSIDIPLACFVLIAMLSSIINHIVPYKIAAFDLYLLLKGFLVFYIFYNLSFDVKEIRKIMKIFFIISLPIFLFGVIDLVAPGPFRAFVHNKTFIDYRLGIPSVQSIFIHPGVFGWFMGYFACFYFSFFIYLSKVRYLILFIIFSLGVLFSMRFKPIIGLFTSILMAFAFISAQKRIKFILISGILVIFFILIFGTKTKFLFEDKVYSYLQSPGLNKEARNILYNTGFRIAKDFFPLGSGLGTFGGWIAALYYSPLYSKYGISPVYGLGPRGHFLTDTFWPYIIGEFGVIGTICYIWIIASLFSGTIKAFKETHDIFLKAFLLSTIMAFTEGLVETLGGSVLTASPQFYFIFAILGIAHSIHRKHL